MNHTATEEEIATAERHVAQIRFEREGEGAPSWFSLTLPGEEPPWGRGKLRWRRRHERIRSLELALDFYRGGHHRTFPWENYSY